ncbi:MAG: PDZ domain-containing protein [Candidatus Dormibacteria bacterium]
MLNGGYFRRPSVHQDTIAFASEDDLWFVPRGGGVASRVTAGVGEARSPALSPDGLQLTFVAEHEHHPEIFCMPSEGGPARRLTWLGANTGLGGWMPDGRILGITNARQAMARLSAAVAIDPASGALEWLRLGPCHGMSWAPAGGGVVLGRHTLDPARWKRYRGGTAGQLWVDARGTGSYKRILAKLGGNLASPMWVGQRIYFISDHQGIGNIYSCRPDGADVQRHTDHGEYYARYASTDGRTIVYQHAAEVWALDVAADTAARVDIDFRSPRAQRSRKFVPAADYLGGFSVHPDGHSIAIETRGKLFSFALWEGGVRQHGVADGVRYRMSRWSSDGKALVSIGDEGGDDVITILNVERPAAARRLGGLSVGIPMAIAVSPKRDLVAIANQRHELLLVDLEKSTSRVIDRSDFDEVQDVAWSPDGRWLAYSFPSTERTRSIRLFETSRSKVHQLTSARFVDFSPSWDPSGDHLFFLSARGFDPVAGGLFLEHGFPRTVKPYAMTLRADVRSPFVPLPRGMGDAVPSPSPGAGEAPDPASKTAPKAAPKAPRVVVELDGIEDRVVEFPVEDGIYRRLVAVPGKVLWLAGPVEGMLGAQSLSLEAPSNASLEAWDLVERRKETLAGGIVDFEVSRDGSTLVYLGNRRLRALKVGARPPEGPDAEGPPNRRNGWIDLDRVRVSVDPVAEWRQMYTEAWRLQREYFWVSDMSGVEWRRVHDRYLPLIDKIGCRGEFADLMWEMQGELGTSHAYDLGGDYRRAAPSPVGFLGADLELDGGRWVVRRIVRGDAWKSAAASPLQAPGVNVVEGDVVLAVNGRPVGPNLSPAQLLVNQAGQTVELTIAGRGSRPSREVVVTTLAGEFELRYREWVEENRRRVFEATAGRVGYIHIPDMGATGYSEFHRAYFSEVEREGLIVDVRCNGGGYVSQMLLEKLARRRIGFDAQRYGQPAPYPSDSPAGPMVCITDENAGSDGDIFSHCFKLLGLGPLVGKRTWGGVIGIGPRHQLADGGVTTQPEYSFWFADVGWGVENYGTDPDFDVDIRPQDWAAGRDPQLDKALQLVSAALRKHRPLRPDMEGRPRLALPVLPPR